MRSHPSNRTNQEDKQLPNLEELGGSYPTGFAWTLQRRHGPVSRGNLSSPMDSSLPCPTLLRFKGGSKESGSESIDPLDGAGRSFAKGYPIVDSRRSLGWLAVASGGRAGGTDSRGRVAGELRFI